MSVLKNTIAIVLLTLFVSACGTDDSSSSQLNESVLLNPLSNAVVIDSVHSKNIVIGPNNDQQMLVSAKLQVATNSCLAINAGTFKLSTELVEGIIYITAMNTKASEIKEIFCPSIYEPTFKTIETTVNLENVRQVIVKHVGSMDSEIVMDDEN